MNQKKRTRAGTIALYVLAVLLLCYGVYMMYSAYDYVSQYYAYQGMDIGSNLAEAVQYMVSQSYLYLCFALLFYVVGVILQKLNDLHACLIPQKSLCVRSGLPVEEIRLCHLIQDPDCTKLFRSLMQELRDKPLYYKADVQARLVSFLVQLARCHGMERRERSHHSRASKEYMVKRAVEYLQENFTQRVSTEDVCAYLGFDKSYICNTFKEITGTTVLEYLNMMRCERARELILSGELSIAQSAAASGFRHWSYFTKTYKKYIGRLPSETARSGME